MDRLTDRMLDGTACVYVESGTEITGYETTRSQIISRLAAYEDIGLEPEEIIDSIGFMSPVCVQCDGKTQEGARTEKCGYSHGDLTKCLKQSAHLSELARAEQDGRLVVLPCKDVYIPTWDAG